MERCAGGRWESPLGGQCNCAYWCKHHEFPNVGIVNEGHNGYLDTFVETGLVGDAMILLLVLFMRGAQCGNVITAMTWRVFVLFSS